MVYLFEIDFSRMGSFFMLDLKVCEMKDFLFLGYSFYGINGLNISINELFLTAFIQIYFKIVSKTNSSLFLPSPIVYSFNCLISISYAMKRLTFPYSEDICEIL